MSTFRILCGNALEVLPTLAACSVDAVVTDPPYGLSFMGKDWDHGIPGEAFWREALRVAKPGAHLLAFGGTRTFHRLTCAIEDAGWEIRDCLMWVYGSGFPKSLDVSKAIDKAAGATREATRSATAISWDQRASSERARFDLPVTESARRWQGWGTALKPAWEPIILARKPLEGTVAENVQQWGTGALNIDGCRIEGAAGSGVWGSSNRTCQDGRTFNGSPDGEEYRSAAHPSGRWPANLIHDGSEEVVGMFQEEAGAFAPVRGTEPSTPAVNTFGTYKRGGGAFHADAGSAARFFYCAKASKEDREEGLEFLPAVRPSDGRSTEHEVPNLRTSPRANHHPTVKPTSLMSYLCRLVTPPGGTILDPFMGSGSTGRGAMLGGFDFIGIDLAQEYVEIAKRRIEQVAPLFAESAR